jgi:hypothetical protein
MTVFLQNPKVNFSVYNSPPLDPTLSQLIPIRALTPFFFRIPFFPFSLRLRSPKNLFPSGRQWKFYAYF